jgi:trk system potassium uptake protein TrkA
MRIIILGAGRVGTSLARNLVKENNDVVLVDSNAEHLEKIKNSVDIQTVTGLASSPTVLIQAGVRHADLVIAVTNYDDTNMVACYIAQHLFSVPKTIAKIKSEDYYNYPKLFQKTHMPITILINPERLITNYIIRIIQYPGIAELLYFSDDKTCLVTIEIQKGDWLNGKRIGDLQDKLHKINTSIVAIFSKKKIHTRRRQLSTNT